jgi:PhnB protein
MQIQPYLNFNGRCEEALQFYSKSLGAKVEMMMRFKEMPGPQAPGMTAPPDKILHAAFRVGDTQLLASDGECTGKPAFGGIALSLTARDDAEAKRQFSALSEGGKVKQPLIPTFFASSFGMVDDRFGVSWMVIASKEPQHG